MMANRMLDVDVLLGVVLCSFYVVVCFPNPWTRIAQAFVISAGPLEGEGP
jgi:hypothetical protein